MKEEFEVRPATARIDDTASFVEVLRGISERTGCRIVCLDADCIAGARHAEAAVRHAMRAVNRGDAISNTLEMEVLLYAGGTRQCSQAARFGVHRGLNRLYICLVPPSGEAVAALSHVMNFEDTGWETLDEEKVRRLSSLFSITPEEVQAVGLERFRDLVVERVALLDVYR